MPPRRSTKHPTAQHDAPDNLAALIRREQDASGASYADIAKRAGLPKAKVSQIADPASTHQVRPETIELLVSQLERLSDDDLALFEAMVTTALRRQGNG